MRVLAWTNESLVADTEDGVRTSTRWQSDPRTPGKIASMPAGILFGRSCVPQHKKMKWKRKFAFARYLKLRHPLSEGQLAHEAETRR